MLSHCRSRINNFSNTVLVVVEEQSLKELLLDVAIADSCRAVVLNEWACEYLRVELESSPNA